MHGRTKNLLRAGFLAAVAAAGVSLLFTANKGVDADMVSLLGDAAGGGLREAASATSVSAEFLVKAGSREAASARLKELGVDVPKTEPDMKITEALSPYARGFLSPSTRELLERGEFAAVRDAAAARLFSPVPPFLVPQKDPFLLFTDYVLSSEERHGEWIAVRTELTPAQALAALAAVKGADDVRCAGAPFHTAVASENSKREINILSPVSFAVAMLFGWLLARSFVFLPVLAAALAAALCVASAALFAFFPKPHAVAFVFGTTLIGMGVDYVYHALAAGRSAARPLAASLASTVACFLPLMFSGVGVLSQMAVFTVAGLFAVFAVAVAFARPCGCGSAAETVPGRGTDSGRKGASLAVRIAVLLAIGALPLLCARMCGCGAGDGTDVSRLYRPDPYLAEGERIALEMSGGEGFVPSPAAQRRNAALVRRLFEAEGTNYCAMTGLPPSVLELPQGDPVFAPRDDLNAALSRWAKESDRLLLVAMLVLSAVFAVFRRRTFLDFTLPMFVAYGCTDAVLSFMGEGGNFFGRICFFVSIGLGFDYSVFRAHAAQLGDRGEGGRMASRAVFYSFLTSLAGFGMLAFTDFVVTRLMGIALAVGLSSSYAAAKFSSGISEAIARLRGQDDGAAVWHEQRERCASLFWARFMWYSYAWFGKNFQKIIFVIGMPVIYLLSAPARVELSKFYGVLSAFTGRKTRATLPRLFMHILGFAWGLMDKTDSCTLRKNQPSMSVRDDGAWRAFLDTVNSGKGAFLLCTHEGTIGVLPSLPDALRRSSTDAAVRNMRIPKVNAFQQMGHDAVFMKVFMEHFDASRIKLHAVEDIGVETAVEMKAAIERGELVIMAGDRVGAGSSSVTRHRFMGRDCLWPKGVYRFAKLMESPVFAVTCVRTGWNRYEVHFAGLAREPSAMLDGFVDFLERETVARPEQWYQFYDFFGDVPDESQKANITARR